MAKVYDAQCKRCNSKLTLDIEQHDAFCPYCGQKLIDQGDTSGLVINKIKNIFKKKKYGIEKAGFLEPDNPGCRRRACSCDVCNHRSVIDASQKQAYCKNCGENLINEGKPVHFKPVNFSGYYMFHKKACIIAIAAVLLLFTLIGAILDNDSSDKHGLSKKRDAAVETTTDPTVLEAVDTQIEQTLAPTELQTEKPTEPPTEKPTEPPTEKPTEPPTEPPTAKPTVSPTVFIADNTSSANDPDNSADYTSHTYILNTKSHKFHYPDCGSAGQIKEENKQSYYGNRDDLISMGYSPCGNCCP